MNFENSLSFAKAQDAADELAPLRAEYLFPESGTLYFAGHSLGLQPRKAREYVLQELDEWARLAVEGHFASRNPWVRYHELLTGPTARLIGALPHEVVVMSLVRARFCEQLAASGRQSFNELDLFLLGMLSLLDVMTGRPIAEMIAQLRISEQLRAALLSRAGPMGMLLDTVQAFERADWDKVEGLAKALGIDETAFAAAYRESVEWADKVYTG